MDSSATLPATAAGAGAIAPYRPRHPVRIVTAASLFDGHDAAIHIMRRLIQATGCEVIHLGHNRSVDSIVTAAIQEDAQGIAISSYQGGHMEFFRYARDLLVERGAGEIRIFGGGGGTIVPEEKRALEAYGIAAIYGPEDGRRMGLQGMINDLVRRCDRPLGDLEEGLGGLLRSDDEWVRIRALARGISWAEAAAAGQIEAGLWRDRRAEVGTGQDRGFCSTVSDLRVGWDPSDAKLGRQGPTRSRDSARGERAKRAEALPRPSPSGARGRVGESSGKASLSRGRGSQPSQWRSPPGPVHHLPRWLTGPGRQGATAPDAVGNPRQATLSREWGPRGGTPEKIAEIGQRAAESSDRSPEIKAAATRNDAPVIGLTGTGGAGKSSLVDELVRRYVQDFPERRVAVLSVDPTRKRTGGALLGDRIRMNVLDVNAATPGRVFARSLATRGSGSELSGALRDAIELCRAAGFDAILAETSGIGQADSGIVELVDIAVYVMTPEYGAPSQLEKIEMIDLADLVVINKFDKPGALDAIRDVRKAYQRAHQRFAERPEAMPVHAAIASRFNDRGCNTVYRALLERIATLRGEGVPRGRFTEGLPTGLPERHHLIPPRRSRYLGEIADAVRAYKSHAAEQAEIAGELQGLRLACERLGGPSAALPVRPLLGGGQAEHLHHSEVLLAIAESHDELLARLDPHGRELLDEWPELTARYRASRNAYEVRGRRIEVENHVESLSGTPVPRVALPRFSAWSEILRWRLLENLPGAFPFAGGVFPFKRQGEDPTRMFAGEGGPWRTNKRFHLLSRHSEAKRLSTAFDSVTLYGEDPDERPDIRGKIGNSGVSVATVEDMEALYAGFDLCDPRTSVSMTINGPAPTILAFYFHTAVRQQLRRLLRERGAIDISVADCLQPGGGGYSFDELRAMVGDREYAELIDRTVCRCRGTVQADILKEDQAQNTCIFSTDFALKLMGDVQQWFIDHEVRSFYSVSISGYHIAEAGANPITQTAFTLANGFTFVEYYRARGMDVDRFTANFSYFFSNGMDPEYAVIGRVARRIWAVAMRDLYGAGERAQKLKYHIQTSGRSLHAREIAFNDIRTTLQALLAVYDNCNSLHTNAYDEAITTPTEESVRRALAIQLILNREFGLAGNENPNQGAFIIDELTELVEEAVLAEFGRLDERGGVLGAMERMYQRSRIQQESLEYEHRKHTGELPIIGVNTFTAKDAAPEPSTVELIRSSDDEKRAQLERLRDFQRRHAARSTEAAARLKAAVIAGQNVFVELMRAVEVLSLGQVSRALYEVGGQYRRSM